MGGASLTKWILNDDEEHNCCLLGQVHRLVSTQVAGSTSVRRHCSSWSDADAADGLQGVS